MILLKEKEKCFGQMAIKPIFPHFACTPRGSLDVQNGGPIQNHMMDVICICGVKRPRMTFDDLFILCIIL